MRFELQRETDKSDTLTLEWLDSVHILIKSNSLQTQLVKKTHLYQLIHMACASDNKF